jgi:hypothetical protein
MAPRDAPMQRHSLCPGDPHPSPPPPAGREDRSQSPIKRREPRHLIKPLSGALGMYSCPCSLATSGTRAPASVHHSASTQAPAT